MKLIHRIFLFALSIAAISGCVHPTEKAEEKENLNQQYPWSETEKIVRSNFDWMAVFTWSNYRQLMIKLSEDKFVVLPINEMRGYFDSTKVVIGLRHDIDNNPFKALEMAEIEKSYGFRSTYFVLATSMYYGQIVNNEMKRNPGMDSLYKKLNDTGAEIGIHNDLLTVMIAWKLDPFSFNSEELDFYRSIGITIHGTAAHGSEIAKATVPNYEIFSDFAKQKTIEYESNTYPIGIKTLREFGFEYESYFIPYKIYFSDSGGKWNDPDGLTGILNKLDHSKPGDRIQILAHPDWWGKN